jgi:hypothetical protein
MDCVSNDAEVGARARLRAERDIFFHSHCRPASVLAFCQRGAGEPLVILSITRRGRAVWCQRRRSPARKARSAHSSGSSRNFAAQSPGCALSRVFSHAKRLAQPPCNSRASARFDFPSARRSISRRASDSGRFSSLQIGTALQCASIEPRSASSDASGVRGTKRWTGLASSRVFAPLVIDRQLIFLGEQCSGDPNRKRFGGLA